MEKNFQERNEHTQRVLKSDKQPGTIEFFLFIMINIVFIIKVFFYVHLSLFLYTA